MVIPGRQKTEKDIQQNEQSIDFGKYFIRFLRLGFPRISHSFHYRFLYFLSSLLKLFQLQLLNSVYAIEDFISTYTIHIIAHELNLNDFSFKLNFSHGKSKVLTGAALWGVGAITNNQNLQQTGQALAGLGLLSKAGGLIG